MDKNEVLKDISFFLALLNQNCHSLVGSGGDMHYGSCPLETYISKGEKG